MAWTKEKAEETMRAILTKADDDEAFRTRFVADPKEVIVDEAGIELPESLNIKVIDMNDTDLIIKLPRQEGALKDSELEAVAGGFYIAGLEEQLQAQMQEFGNPDYRP